MLFAAFALLGLGLVMVASATLHRVADAPFHYLNRHLIALLLGSLSATLVFLTPVRYWQRSGALLFIVGLLLLVLVLVPGVGREANGATRWIPLGAFNLQSSEFMKLFLVIYLAGYLVRRQEEVATSVWGFMKPLALLLLASGLIMLQPDFGTTAVLLATAMGMLFLGGVPLWQFGVLVGLCAIATVVTRAGPPSKASARSSASTCCRNRATSARAWSTCSSTTSRSTWSTARATCRRWTCAGSTRWCRWKRATTAPSCRWRPRRARTRCTPTG